MKKNLKNKKDNNKREFSIKGKNYFVPIFIGFSFLMFFILVFSLFWLKNSLFLAKDQVASDFVYNTRMNAISPGLDPLVDVKGQKDTVLEGPILSTNDPFLGDNLDKKIKLFYFSDFDCPFCFEQEEIIKNIYEKYKENLVVVWKDYPDLSDINNFSYQAARAARCAQRQNSFWDYGQLLYGKKNNFQDIKSDLFVGLAEKLGLNLSIFSNCLKGNNVDFLILENVIEAENLGVLGVPYIYINNKEFIGSLGEEELDQIIQNELNDDSY